jgi:hypothetical protein
VKASSATNAGNATPAALLQTWLYTLRTHDVEGHLSIAEWPDGASDAAKMDELNRYNQIRRNSDPTSEPEEYRLTALWPIGDDLFLAAFRESRDPTQVDVGTQFFRKTPKGWKIMAYTPEQAAFLKQDGGGVLNYK